MESRLNHALGVAGAQGLELGTFAQNKAKGTQKNRLPRPGFTCYGGETRVQGQIDVVDQHVILDAQVLQHGLTQSFGVALDVSGVKFFADV